MFRSKDDVSRTARKLVVLSKKRVELCSRYFNAIVAVDRSGTIVESTRSGKQCAAYHWKRKGTVLAALNDGCKVVMACACVIGKNAKLII